MSFSKTTDLVSVDPVSSRDFDRVGESRSRRLNDIFECLHDRAERLLGFVDGRDRGMRGPEVVSWQSDTIRLPRFGNGN